MFRNDRLAIYAVIGAALIFLHVIARAYDETAISEGLFWLAWALIISVGIARRYQSKYPNQWNGYRSLLYGSMLSLFPSRSRQPTTTEQKAGDFVTCQSDRNADRKEAGE